MTAKRTWYEIIQSAIDQYAPSHIICLFSGGYDSMVTTHLAHTREWGLPLLVYAIDTQLSADGWRDYVDGVAHGFGWRFDIYDNKKGWGQMIEFVRFHGCPRTRAGHTHVYRRLKERAIMQMLKDHKICRGDKTLFLSGARRAESMARKNAPEINRLGTSSAVFANPLLYWSNERVVNYRLGNDLPANPFYETVGGSGDCQCNWGNFITMRKLKKYSPCLAAGNVGTIDQISRDCHGYGWDGKQEGQTKMFDDYEDDGSISPFLCAGCGRAKAPRPGLRDAQETAMLQRGLFQ